MTIFGALMDKIWALTPMCNFEQPEVLCSNEEGRTTQGENE
jgi:hypothetical protein